MINVKELPQEPGVYLFKDAQDIIYVGKAKKLRSRVSSYFSKSNKSLKTSFLVRNIKDMDFIVVDTEVEALLLENRLIKKHKPKYNISLKDAKTYAYILVTDEAFPKVLTTRKVAKKGTLFGPYTQGLSRQEIVQLTLKLFKLRVCKKLPKKACLNYHIGLCTAPCIKNVSQEEYGEQVKQALHFLKGNTKEVVKKLTLEMKEASTEMQYEVALEKKNQIKAITHLHDKQKVDLVKRFDQDVVALQKDAQKAVIQLFTIKKGVISGKKSFRFDFDEELYASFIKMYYSQNHIPNEIIVNEHIKDREAIENYLAKIKGLKVKITKPLRGEKAALMRLALKNAKLEVENKVLLEMQEKLLLPSMPRVIECFDMSNLGSEFLVGGMVQYVDGQPFKNGYRRFEIKTVEGQDDFASMFECVFRRYKRLKEEKKPYPDLIIIDGGMGQLNASLSALKQLGLTIPIIGLAKKEEEIYLPEDPTPLKFPKNKPMMLLIRQIRDSVHRFVVSYNRKKREMRLRES